MKSLFIVVLLSLIRMQTLACSCVSTPLDTAFSQASMVFVGKVREIVDNKLHSNLGHSFKIINFEVLEVIKKTIVRTNTLSLIDDQSSCSFFFEEGKTYVVFAYALATGLFETSTCSRTSRVEAFNKADFEKLKVLPAFHLEDVYHTDGSITLSEAEHNLLLNKVKQLEKDIAIYKRNKNSLTWIIIILAFFLLINMGINYYLIKKK